MLKRRENADEGRATQARPSLCLLAALLGLCVPALLAPAAHAEQLETLVIVKTSPSSKSNAPAHSTTPLVFGGEEGSITAAIRFGSGSDPITAGASPDNEVAIYANPSCKGEEPLGTGTLEEFEETGIQVEVPPDSETTFYAIQLDPNEVDEPSACPPQGFTYWESSSVTPPNEPPGGGGPGGGAGGTDSTAAPQAPHLRTVPAHRANDNTPLLTGEAQGAGSVKVFVSSNCNGAPVANGSVAEFSVGLPVHVSDDSTTTFSAVSLASGKQSECSEPATYVEDSIAPRTRITMAPGVKTRKRKAVFRFADITEDPPGTTFLCRVDHGRWRQCSSPFKLRHLRARIYVLRVKAVDLAGNAEAKGAKRRFKVIRG